MGAWRQIIWFSTGFALATALAACLQAVPAHAQSSPRHAGQKSAPSTPPDLRGAMDRDPAGSADDVDDADLARTDAPPAPRAATAETPADFRAAVIDDATSETSEPQAPIDGALEPPEPANAPDPSDPIRHDTRAPDDIAAFESPPAGHDPLLYQIEELEPRQDRRTERLARFEPFDPVGIRMGSFVVFPEVEVSALAVRNVLLAPTARSDIAGELAPTLRIVSDWRAHALELRANGKINGHDAYPSEDDKTYRLEARGRLDVTRKTNLQAEISRDVSLESRQVLEASRSATGRSEVTTDQFQGTLNHRFNRLSLQLRGLVAETSYADPSPGAGASDRNYTRTAETLRATWEWKPTLFTFAEVGLEQRDYAVAAASDGLSRSSNGERLRIGLSFGNNGSVLRGETSLGWGRQATDSDRLPEVSGMIIDANLAWRVTPLTSLLVTAKTDFTESDVQATAGALTRQIGLDVRHAFLRRLIATAGISYTVADYAGIAIVEHDVRETLSLEYYASRDLVLFTRYQHTDYSTNAPASSYTNDEIRVGMRVRR